MTWAAHMKSEEKFSWSPSVIGNEARFFARETATDLS